MKIPVCLLRVMFIIFMGGIVPAHAFFPVPDPLYLDVGTNGVARVEGSDIDAKVSLQSIGITGTDGGLTHNLKGTRNGKGFVEVILTAVKPGNYVVTFSGKNNTDLVEGSITVIVRNPPKTSAQNKQIAVAGDPVSTSTGEYFGVEAVDLNLGGPMPLLFVRYVASSLDEDAMVDAGLGSNRTHNYASRILSELGSTVKRVVLPAGRVLFFQQAGTKWVLKQPLDVPYQLVQTGGNFLLGHPDTQQIWTYDSAGLLTKVEDGRGNAHLLSYTAGKLTSISDGLGRVINISQPGNTISSISGEIGEDAREVAFDYTDDVLTSATDYGGHVTTYGNTDGQLTSITRPQGNVLFTQSYTDGQVTSQTERDTDTSTLLYEDGVTTFTDPEGETLVDHYDASGNLISHVDEAGHAITMTYDSAGRRSSVTDRLGNKVTMLYHAPSGLLANMINAEGKSTLRTYKARTLSGLVFYDLVKVIWPDLSSRSMAYDAKGNLTQITDEAGKNWKFSYNTRGQVLTATNPLGAVTINTYDGFGNLLTTQPPELGQTTFEYDDRLRLEQILRPGGGTVQITYDTKDRITSVTDERGKVRQYSYDSNDRVTTFTDPDNQTATLGYDVLDRVTTLTDRLSKPTLQAFNSRRLVSSITDANSNTVNLDYDELHRLATFQDAGGQNWTFEYDAEGRMTSLKDPINPPATRRLNKLGHPVEIRNPLGDTTQLKRDAMQRVTHIFDPLGRQTSFVYDKRGLLISATQQGTGTAKYDRDALGNVTKITDPNGGAWSTAYLKSGRVQKLTDPLGKATSFTYDNRGRLATTTFPDATTCTMSYDLADHPTATLYSAGPNITFTYDNLGRLESARQPGFEEGDVEFEYDAEGRLTNSRQNAHDFTATYDDGGRLETVSYLDGALTVTYAYDSRDRLTSVTDSEGTILTLDYDNAGRLTSLTRPSGLNGTYSYDDAGRLIRIQEEGLLDLIYTLNTASEVTAVDYTAPAIPVVTPATQLLKFGKAGEITSAGYLYDVRGRLTQAPSGHTYQWDGASRLVNASGVQLTYNALGGIATRTEGGTTRYYHHHALGLAPIVYEDTAAGSDRAYIWTPEGRLLYSVDMGTGDPTFYHFDRMGSTLVLTDKDGEPTDTYAYGPYGEPLVRSGTSTQPFTFIGAYGVRAEGPLYHMRARYYDPMAARFLSRDPLAPRLDDPKSANRYAYADQNPLMYMDLLGATSESERAIRNRMDAMALGVGPFFIMAFELDVQIEKHDKALEALEKVKEINDNLEKMNAANLARSGVGIGSGHSTAQILVSPESATQGAIFPGAPAGAGTAFPNLIASQGGGFAAAGNAGDKNTLISPPSITASAGSHAVGNGQAAGNGSLVNATAAANGLLLQQFISVYNSVKFAEDSLIKDMNRTLSGDAKKVRAYEDIKRQRKALGKVIQKLGGTLP